MNLKLEKPIVFFDLETTGVQVATDRIVEISILKVFPNGNKESKNLIRQAPALGPYVKMRTPFV